MKVLFDLLTIRYAQNSGIVTYATRILDSWHAMNMKNVTVLVGHFWEKMLTSRWPNFKGLVIQIPETGGYTRRGLAVGYKRKQVIDASGCDVVFAPMPEPLFFEMPKAPQVTVIHDMLAPKIAKGKHWFYHNFLLPYQIRRCKKVICISECTKRTALNEYSFLRKDSVHVVYNPVAWSEKSFPPYFDFPYILCINTISPYKNAITLVKAFGRIAMKTSCRLVFVGIVWGDYWSQMKQVAEKEGFADRMLHLQDLSDDEIIALYQHAELFVSPSTMEGFGQTPIEAAIYKCPVITSQVSALPEVTMGLLHYYHPATDDEALAQKMELVLKAPPSETQLEDISDKMKSSYDPMAQSRKIYDEIVSTAPQL